MTFSANKPVVVLLVEDSQADAVLIRESLVESDRPPFRVHHASRISEALMLLDEQPIDVVLLDLNLPDSVGLDTFQTVQRHEVTRPIVILTGTDDEDLGIEAVSQGAQDFLPKGQFDHGLIARLIRYAIVRHEADQELKRLHTEMANQSALHQQQIGQQLHDGLGQHLTGVAMIAGSLHRRLEMEESSAAQTAAELKQLIVDAQGQLRALVKGLHPVDVDAQGLRSALGDLAESTAKLTGITCDFFTRGSVSVNDNATATQVYLIAQEAITNAVRYASASRITVELDGDSDRIRLDVQDDGAGLPDSSAETSSGMGLRIMHHRAESIGAELTVGNAGPGVLVRCLLPSRSASDARDRRGVSIA